MKKKKPEKSRSELEREEREQRELLDKNARELELALIKYCQEYDLDLEPPFSHEEAEEILRAAKQAEFEKLLKIFPNYLSLSESQKMNAKLIVKFGLDPKMSLRDLTKINEAISRKLGGASYSSEANPDVYRFKK